jgi:hypothetical protein
VTLAAVAAALVPVRRARARAAATGPRAAARVHATFWGVAARMVAAAFVLSGIPDGDQAHSAPAARYVVPLVLAAVAVVPVAARRSRARAVAGGLAALGLVGGAVVGLAARDLERTQRPPLAAQAGAIADWLGGQGVRRGYASHWNATPSATTPACAWHPCAPASTPAGAPSAPSR